VIRRGRVLAIDGEVAVVRGERADARVAGAAGWRPGDLVEVAADPERDPRADRAAPDGAAAAAAGSDLAEATGAPGWRRVRAYAGPLYPGPRTEVVRMPRERLHNLQARAQALAALRDYFRDEGFLEVETPLLVPAPGLELHLEAVPAGAGFLITSPEYQMKRLLAAGCERIYQVCRCFRANEAGPHHATEFTMVEWYRGYAELSAIAADVEALVAAVCAAVAGGPVARVGGIAGQPARAIDVTPPWPRLSVRDAMMRYAGVAVLGDEPAPVLAATVRAAGIDVPGDAAWDDAFFAAFVARVEPALAALDRPVLLEDWPAPLAALAQRSATDPAIAHRFEAYVGGIELANAFGELTDPAEQRARFEADLRAREARGKPRYAIDERLLAALAEGLPPSAGVALGFDRLVMLATGASAIDEVLAFTAAEL
jgi:lysyl-tRNA synthetase class 2